MTDDAAFTGTTTSSTSSNDDEQALQQERIQDECADATGTRLGRAYNKVNCVKRWVCNRGKHAGAGVSYPKGSGPTQERINPDGTITKCRLKGESSQLNEDETKAYLNAINAEFGGYTEWQTDYMKEQIMADETLTPAQRRSLTERILPTINNEFGTRSQRPDEEKSFKHMLEQWEQDPKLADKLRPDSKGSLYAGFSVTTWPGYGRLDHATYAEIVPSEKKFIVYQSFDQPPEWDSGSGDTPTQEQYINMNVKRHLDAFLSNSGYTGEIRYTGAQGEDTACWLHSFKAGKRAMKGIDPKVSNRKEANRLSKRFIDDFVDRDYQYKVKVLQYPDWKRKFKK